MWPVRSVDLPNLWQKSVNGQSCSASLSTLWSLLIFNLISVVHGGDYMTVSHSSAIVNITYQNPLTDSMHSEVDEKGHYGDTSRLSSESGYVVHMHTLTLDSGSPSCVISPVSLPAERWIALVDKGSCKLAFILSASLLRNASAIVVYNQADTHEVQSRRLKSDYVSVHVFVSSEFGQHIGTLVDNGTRVFMQISIGRHHTTYYSTINKTSMLFLSISFIVLMIISLAWLVFYYVQRSRYTYAKQRLSRRLMYAAKKAIGKMPIRTLHTGDEEMETGFDMCAVCIEGYRSCDVIRILPCKHVFHKSCIDPWLIEHRSCPICKIDILKAFGLQVYRSRESALNVEPDVVSTSFGYSEFVAPDAGIVRDFDSDGVEIVRFQLAHIEYHRGSAMTDDISDEPGADNELASTASVSGVVTTEAQASIECIQHIDDDNDDVVGSKTEVPSAAAVAAHPPSLDSTKSEESEPNETQSLMTGGMHTC